MTTPALLAEDPTPQEAEAAPPDWIEDDYPAAESITITHGDDGTEIVIEDVTPIEFAALVVIALVVVSVAFMAWRSKRERRRNYRL